MCIGEAHTLLGEPIKIRRSQGDPATSLWGWPESMSSNGTKTKCYVASAAISWPVKLPSKARRMAEIFMNWILTRDVWYLVIAVCVVLYGDSLAGEILPSFMA